MGMNVVSIFHEHSSNVLCSGRNPPELVRHSNEVFKTPFLKILSFPGLPSLGAVLRSL